MAQSKELPIPKEKLMAVGSGCQTGEFCTCGCGKKANIYAMNLTPGSKDDTQYPFNAACFCPLNHVDKYLFENRPHK